MYPNKSPDQPLQDRQEPWPSRPIGLDSQQGHSSLRTPNASMANLRVLPVGFARTRISASRIVQAAGKRLMELQPAGRCWPLSPFASYGSVPLYQETNQECLFSMTLTPIGCIIRRGTHQQHIITRRSAVRLLSRDDCPFYALQFICGLSGARHQVIDPVPSHHPCSSCAHLSDCV